MLSRRGEADAGSGRRLVGGGREEHFAAGHGRHHPGGEVHGGASDVVATPLDVTDMDAGVDFETEVLQRVLDREHAADRIRDGSEGRKHAVAGVLHQPAAESLDLRSRYTLVFVEHPEIVDSRARRWKTGERKGRVNDAVDSEADDVNDAQHVQNWPYDIMAAIGFGLGLLIPVVVAGWALDEGSWLLA